MRGRLRLLIAVLVLALLGLGGLMVARGPNRVASPTAPALPPAPASPTDAVAAQMVDAVRSYRKIIVLLSDEAQQPDAERARAGQVGRIIYHENQDRLRRLEEQLTAHIEGPRTSPAAGPPGTSSLPRVERFLDELERRPDLHDADKLAFRDVLGGLAAAFAAGPAAKAPADLVKRVTDDLAALRTIQSLYEKEFDQIFARFETRGMPVRREAWDRYLAAIRREHDRAAILKEYAGHVAAPAAATRGDAGPTAGVREEITGRRFPPKTLLLTFDDGPHFRYTPRFLEILKRFDVPAVFFHVGQTIGGVKANDEIYLERGSEASRQVLAAGLPLGNHSYTHAFLPRLSETDLAKEIDRTNRLISHLSRQPNVLFRPPYGARNDQVVSALRARGLRSIMWNVDSRDWADPIPRSIAHRVLRTIESEGRGIILFHDIHERTLEAVPVVLETLQEQGYRFATWTGNEFAARKPADRGVATAAPAVPPPNLYRESWAVIVGIDAYEKWPALRYAVNDARGMRDLLIQKYKFKPENITMLLNQDATRRNILSASATGSRTGTW